MTTFDKRNYIRRRLWSSKKNQSTSITLDGSNDCDIATNTFEDKSAINNDFSKSHNISDRHENYVQKTNNYQRKLDQNMFYGGQSITNEFNSDTTNNQKVIANQNFHHEAEFDDQDFQQVKYLETNYQTDSDGSDQDDSKLKSNNDFFSEIYEDLDKKVRNHFYINQNLKEPICLDSFPPLINKPWPWRSILLVFMLCISGIIFLTSAFKIYIEDHNTQRKSDKSPFIYAFLGLICIIPGFYHLFVLIFIFFEILNFTRKDLWSTFSCDQAS